MSGQRNYVPMNKQHSTWFIIVTYKPDKEALRRLMAAIGTYRAIVVDNTGNNIGYGRAANHGMKQAFEAGAKWVIVCNQDIRISQAGITHFCAMAQKCAPGIVGPEAGTLDPKRWTTVLASRPGLEAGSQINYISGSFMAIHRDVWQATNGFYEPYFMYYEDVDLCVRARKLEFPLKQIYIEGFRHGSIQKDGKKNWIPDQVRDDITNDRYDRNVAKEYFLARNHLLFVRRLAPLSVKLHELLRIPKTLMEHNQQRNIEAIKGVRDFAVGRFGKKSSY